MMLEAERTLLRCDVAHQMLEDEYDEEKWWIIWIGAMTTLRSIGDVLKNIDGKDADGKSNLVGQTQERLFREKWKDDPMFSDFIKAERDILAHEAKSHASEVPSTLAVVVDGMFDGTFTISPDLFRPINYGHMAGEDARDVYKAAVEWWGVQISEIKTTLA